MLSTTRRMAPENGLRRILLGLLPLSRAFSSVSLGRLERPLYLKINAGRGTSVRTSVGFCLPHSWNAPMARRAGGHILQPYCNRGGTGRYTTDIHHCARVGFVAQLKEMAGYSGTHRNARAPFLQGGGRWFEPSIAHFEKVLICRKNLGYEKGPDENPALSDTTFTPPGAIRGHCPSRRRPRRPCRAAYGCRCRG
jgi:hypothetical protein